MPIEPAHGRCAHTISCYRHSLAGALWTLVASASAPYIGHRYSPYLLLLGTVLDPQQVHLSLSLKGPVYPADCHLLIPAYCRSC